MKKTFLIILFSGITYLGCSDNLNNTLVSSPIESPDFINQKLALHEFENLTDSTLKGDRQLPQNVDSTDSKKLMISQVIDGEIGGEIVLDTTYVNCEGRLLNVYARLKFDPGVFDGLKRINMVPSPEDLSIKLFPHITFNEIVKLDYIITGLDLAAIGFT